MNDVDVLDGDRVMNCCEFMLESYKGLLNVVDVVEEL